MTREIVSKLLNASISVENKTTTYKNEILKGSSFKIKMVN